MLASIKNKTAKANLTNTTERPNRRTLQALMRLSADRKVHGRECSGNAALRTANATLLEHRLDLVRPGGSNMKLYGQ